ncbi:17841_t:CDS:2 [Racocetra persica]|uniref:17841_t:CDS:1 n=1 Tax=Racocetra persica TaxID=160502 RepID=A0ACA9MMA6_9GLOM|nr:17841_t:CDS:2 [Racocetra persica]
MTANYGGTEIYNPIEWVLKISRNDMPTSVFLLTDGKVLSIGIGDSVSHNLVESVSRADVEACKEIILSAKSHDGPMKLSIPIDPLIQDLDDGTSFIHKHPKNSEKPIPISFIREQTVKLGTKYSLASKYTSFLAIDEKDNELVTVTKDFPNQRVVLIRSSAYSPKSLEIHESFNFRGRTKVHDDIPPVQALSLTITDEQKSTLSTKDNVSF